MRNLSNLVTGAVAIVACMQCDHQMATSRSYFQLFAIPLNRASLRLTLDVYVAQKRLRSEIRVIYPRHCCAACGIQVARGQ